MSTTTPRRITRYGPRQLCEALGLEEWQRIRARQAGIIPAPDAPDGSKWLAVTVAGLVQQRTAIARSVGALPDLGEQRAAEHLTARLGIEVEGHALPELARQGGILVVGYYERYFRDFPLYCGRTLETWPLDALAEVEQANVAGERLTTDRVVDRLGVRRTDVEHLVRLGWLVPVDLVRSSRTPRSQPPDVPLYRAGDVTELLLSEAIDWEAVRGLRSGARSPFASLPDRLAEAAKRSA